MTAVANRRIEKTRVVVFEKDYPATGTPIYRKGEKHFIHMDNVTVLDLSKFAKVSEFDMKGEVEKAKKVLGIKN